MVLLVLFAFILGAVTVVAIEALALWVLICRLSQKDEKKRNEAKAEASVACNSDFNPSLHDKQGDVWVLEPEKVPISRLEDKVTSEQRRRIDTLEVAPVRKYARVKDHFLIITELDGSSVEILLRGCSIVAVSATSLSSKKWAKRYPIKVENKDSAIYKGQQIIYIYLETSWEKESWCKALRLASCDERLKWSSKLSIEFHNYLGLLNAGYPSLMKPSGILSPELMDKSVNLDNPSSKVRQFLKKLAKKASKNGQEHKLSGTSSSAHHDRKLGVRSQSSQDLFLGNSLPKVLQTGKSPNVSFDEISVASSASTCIDQGPRSHLSRTSNADSDFNNFDGGNLDGGAQCLNLVISRLFFDAKNNQQILSFIQNRIQRTLSNMRIPNYIGEVTCTSMNIGTLPPRILAMRLLPSDMNEVLALEIDLEYLGGTVLDFATRLEMRELELHGEDTRVDTNTVDEVTSDLLEGFESIGKQLKLSEETIDEIKQKVEGDHGLDETEISKSTAGASSQLPKWKSLLRSITKQVSQVPLSLGVRISSLRGTIRLCIKPPPSDQLWYGFTSMPDIEFNLDSFVGDHKVTNTHLAFFLINRFKAGIRDTLVLPNRESVGISWMLADKDDWVPKKDAPFMWYRSNQDSTSNTMKRVILCSQPGEATQTIEASHATSEANLDKSKDNASIPQITSEPLGRCASSASSTNESTLSDSHFQELRAPLLEKIKPQDFRSTRKEDKPDIPLHSRSLASHAFSEGSRSSSSAEDEESRLRRLGTRERMRGLGKKMGEKLEVKRRHIEEKGRSFVEKMRGPT